MHAGSLHNRTGLSPLFPVNLPPPRDKAGADAPCRQPARSAVRAPGGIEGGLGGGGGRRRVHRVSIEGNDG